MGCVGFSWVGLAQACLWLDLPWLGLACLGFGVVFGVDFGFGFGLVWLGYVYDIVFSAPSSCLFGSCLLTFCTFRPPLPFPSPPPLFSSPFPSAAPRPGVLPVAPVHVSVASCLASSLSPSPPPSSPSSSSSS